jgi:thiol-disulfide isomerase/thioredoxin
MAKGHIGFRVLAALTLWAGASSVTNAATPTVADILAFKPRQPGVAVTTPDGMQLAACKVELLKGTKLANGKNSSGWVLVDGQGNTVRRFFDSDGDNHIDSYSYYLEGKEAYRDIDSNYDGKVDQFRWLGPNGTKWGVSSNQDGKIDTWKVISAEEVSQEVLQAVITRDPNRLQALMITGAELDSLGLPDSEANRIKNSLSAAPQKFQKTVAGLINLGAKTQWVHLETQAPECLAGDTIGAKADLVHYKQASILFQNGDKHDWISTGELIQVGRTWRIVDAPIQGTGGPESEAGIGSLPDGVKQIVEKELKEIDAHAPKTSTDPASIVKYNLARAAALEKIVAELKGEARDVWIRQLIDCLSTASQTDPKNAKTYDRLVGWTKNIAKEAPGSNIAGYAAYREMSAEYAIKLTTADAATMTKLQEGWRDRLTKFVQDYATAEDTPEALMQLGMVNEFMGKETEAKNWYKQLSDNFRQHPLAAKARGCERRLNLEGQELELTGETLGANAKFNINTLKGKTVVVYYWASWNPQIADDFKKLKTLMSAYASKGVELVCVNLDNAPGDAVNFLKTNQINATHLYQQGGLESSLATQYGVMVLPNLFVVDVGGKVTSRNAQVASLEDELKKLTK